MEKIEAVETIHAELIAGIQLAKCQQCGCMRGALDAIGGQLQGIAEEDANLLAENIAVWSRSMKDIRYTCLGCEHCYPAAAENAFAQAFPEATLPSALVCDFHASQENWPAVIGEYFVLDKTAPVAVSTLGSVQLAETLARMNLPGMAIVGKTETENIGIDKIIKNVATNPSIKFLIVAGNESRGHLSGDTLIALAQNGVDDNGRVVGASGKRPVMRNVSLSEIEAFRKQVQVIDLRGCEDAKEISQRVTELAGEGIQPCSCEEPCADDINLNPPTLSVIPRSETTEADCTDPQCACHTQSKVIPQPEIVEAECADPLCTCHIQSEVVSQPEIVEAECADPLCTCHTQSEVLPQLEIVEAECADPLCTLHTQSDVIPQPEIVEAECADPQCACHTQAKALPPTLMASDFDLNIPLDRAGYFVILPVADRNIINVEHYSYDNNLLHVMEGPNSRGLYLSIVREGWVTDLNHAAYLGKELAKAEISLKFGIHYLQDGA